ncbi:MAG: hypothetical protein M1817_001138 [Caeruleum heppii]|nr:MAG: hypothetical protein M1817_001138 [Caeruleum heppii]
MPPDRSKDLLAYTPMLHARLFAETVKYREHSFQPLRSIPNSVSSSLPAADSKHPTGAGEPYLDGNPSVDRPLIVQFCANDPDALLAAARRVQPFCDAVDLNLGCPQGIAKKGHYGAFLQEDQPLIYSLINTLHGELDVPVTAKIRILETKEDTLRYAKMVIDAGASFLTVHGRRREQKGHNTGVADWSVIRYLRENLPADTVLFANGNILTHDDIGRCLQATGADGIMSAEGNLHDPTIFAEPPAAGDPGDNEREYWRSPNGKEGYRIDGVLRRYLDIIYKHVLETSPPPRLPLFIPSDIQPSSSLTTPSSTIPPSTLNPPHPPSPLSTADLPPPTKKQKRAPQKVTSPSLLAMQAHCFQLLRPLLKDHTHVRDALARSRAGDMAAFENVLSMVQEVTKEGLINLAEHHDIATAEKEESTIPSDPSEENSSTTTTTALIARHKRPFFICQPHIRPLPAEALEKGSMTLSKKEKAKLLQAQSSYSTDTTTTKGDGDLDGREKSDANRAEGKEEEVIRRNVGVSKKRPSPDDGTGKNDVEVEVEVEVQREGVVCG